MMVRPWKNGLLAYSSRYDSERLIGDPGIAESQQDENAV